MTGREREYKRIFGEAVLIISVDQPVAIRSLLEAKAKLLNGWPTKGAIMHRHALHACSLAESGIIPVRNARNAFERAAKEAGILLHRTGQ